MKEPINMELVRQIILSRAYPAIPLGLLDRQMAQEASHREILTDAGILDSTTTHSVGRGGIQILETRSNGPALPLCQKIARAIRDDADWSRLKEATKSDGKELSVDTLIKLAASID